MRRCSRGENRASCKFQAPRPAILGQSRALSHLLLDASVDRDRGQVMRAMTATARIANAKMATSGSRLPLSAISRRAGTSKSTKPPARAERDRRHLFRARSIRASKRIVSPACSPPQTASGLEPSELRSRRRRSWRRWIDQRLSIVRSGNHNRQDGAVFRAIGDGRRRRTGAQDTCTKAFGFGSEERGKEEMGLI